MQSNVFSVNSTDGSVQNSKQLDSNFQVLGIAREYNWQDQFWYIVVISTSGSSNSIIKIDVSTMNTVSSYSIYN